MQVLYSLPTRGRDQMDIEATIGVIRVDSLGFRGFRGFGLRAQGSGIRVEGLVRKYRSTFGGFILYARGGFSD